MDQPTTEQYEQCISELATFCFRKLASLEARFIVLCHRASKLGIDTSDLHPPVTEIEPPAADKPVRIVN